MPRKNQNPNGRGPQQSAPLARARVERTRQPRISGNMLSGDGRIRVRHREYIADVVGSVAFAASAYPMNPGVAASFPWLSSLASLYESYVFHKLHVCYETQRSASTDGSLMLAIDYDAADDAPANKQQLMSYHDAVRSAVWQESTFHASAQDLKKFAQRYVRCGDLSANEDIKTYDVGQLFVCTQGEADATAIGELYIEYDVELITPQLDLAARIACQSAKVVSGGTVSNAAPFGDASVKTGGLSLTATAATMTFDAVGQYLVTLGATGTGVANPTESGTAAVTVLRYNANSAGTISVKLLAVNVTERGQTLVMDYSGSTSITQLIARFAPYAYALA